MEIKAGKVYLSRRGERVLVSAVEATGEWPVHFVVLDGRYKGVGRHDGSRLTIDGRARAPLDGVPRDHWNDLVAESLQDHQTPDGGTEDIHPNPGISAGDFARTG